MQTTAPTKPQKKIVKKKATKKKPTKKVAPQKSNALQGLKYRWYFNPPKQALVNDIGMTHSISQPIAQVLASRGITDHQQIREYLFPDFERDVAPSSKLKDAERAAKRINQAIKNNEKILIFGDYDVDGVTSSSLLLLALKPLGANINFFLPNRKRDGYGLSSKVVKKAVSSGYKLIITVDNGITAIKPAQDALDLGIDLIITDHHRPHSDIPKAYAVINPNQVDCDYPCKYLAGVGVAFKLACLIYEQRNLKLPSKVYELLLLGTVADVVPLVGENRYWVRHGLATINKNRSNAVTVLAQNGKLTKERLSSLDIGFMIAPQINALGRLDDCREAVKFMISSDYSEVERIGLTLLKMNDERKKVDRKIYEQIEGAIVNQVIDLKKENVILACNQDWPAGVIGLVAGKLMHNYGRPTILFHIDKKNNLAKGSCRSIPEFDIFNALDQNKHLLESFGGHTSAAGLSLKLENIPEFKENLEELVRKTVKPEDLQPKLTVDADLDLIDANRNLMKDLEKLEPFGNRNPQPLFMVKNVILLKQPKLLKDKHLKCSVFANGIIKPIIFFNRPDLFPVLLNQEDKPFHIVGNVVSNEWQGNKTIELNCLDVMIPS